MSTQLQRRRGTTVQHSTFTGATGELTVDTTKNTVVVHDGSTAGGFPLLKESAIGVTVQGYDADLATWGAITPAANVGTFLATPSSANLAAAVTDETGTGALVFANTPTLVTPILGTPSSGTLTNCSGLPASGLVTSTSQAVGFGTVELGHASDTTLSRASAGVLAVEGNSVAMLATTQTFTAPQRGTQTTDNDLSMDLSVTNFWSCTPSAGGALTFTNIPTGQGGIIKFVNGSNYAITAAATTKVTSTFLATISVTGTYMIHYYGDGTNVYCSTAGAMA